jgi:hypothetical protein
MKYWQLPLVIEVKARLQWEAHFMTDDLPRCCDSEITHLVLTLFSVG